MDIFTSKTSTYSEVNVNLQKMGFAISENFTMLSFSETSGDSSLLWLGLGQACRLLYRC